VIHPLLNSTRVTIRCAAYQIAKQEREDEIRIPFMWSARTPRKAVNAQKTLTGLPVAVKNRNFLRVPVSILAMAGSLTGLAGWFVLAALVEAQAQPIFVPPRIQAQRLIHRVRPVYPKLAKQAHIQGTVKLVAVIDEEGVVDRLKLISGHPLLVEATFDAVKQWLYRPAIRNGVPVSVITTIEVAFTMDGRSPANKPSVTVRV
jgi:protein TonB